MRRDFRIAALLLAFGLSLAVFFSLSALGFGPRWTPVDSLFYEAQKLEVQGTPRHEALDRVFNSEISRESGPQGSRRDVDWSADYNSVYFRRRWSVPVLAAALDPIFGRRSLMEASLLGWALLAPFLFLLLRRRFTVEASLLSTVFCMLLPPVVMWARAPMTDSWGLTMLVACLLVALLTRDDLRWLPVWIGVVLLGSFTRDLALILVPATAWLAFRERSRRMALISASGALASLPAPLIFPTPLKQTMAIGIELQLGTPSWSWIIDHYPSAVFHHIVKGDLAYPLHVAAPYAALALLMVGPVAAGLVMLFRAGRDPFLILIRATILGAIATILIAGVDSALRHELVLVPVIAAGMALVGERALAYARRRSTRELGLAAGTP
jgi:hypothetical protein